MCWVSIRLILAVGGLSLRCPSGAVIGLYEPRHPTALEFE